MGLGQCPDRSLATEDDRSPNLNFCILIFSKKTNVMILTIEMFVTFFKRKNKKETKKSTCWIVLVKCMVVGVKQKKRPLIYVYEHVGYQYNYLCACFIDGGVCHDSIIMVLQIG